MLLKGTVSKKYNPAINFHQHYGTCTRRMRLCVGMVRSYEYAFRNTTVMHRIPAEEDRAEQVMMKLLEDWFLRLAHKLLELFWKYAWRRGVFFLFCTPSRSHPAAAMGSGAAEDNSPGAEASLQGLPSALLGRILERLPLICSASVALACRSLADSVRDEEALWKSLALRGEGEHAHDAPPEPMAELPAGMPSWRAYVELLHCQVLKGQTISASLGPCPYISMHVSHGASL